ncbi:actin [Entamoeba marina]
MFKKKFNANEFMVRCQCSLRRITVQQKKFQTHNKTFRKEIATLLSNNERDKAFEKCSKLVREDYKSEALNELVGHIDELLKNSEIIASQRICPLELKSSCGAILFAAPYFPDQTEMVEMRNMLIDKFGKTFPEDCINSKVVSANLNTSDVELPQDSPIDIPSQNLPADANRSELSVLTEGVVNERYSFGVLTRDSTGSIKKGGDKVEAYISGPSNARIVGDVTDAHDGTYNIIFVPPYAGEYALAVYINNNPLGQPSRINVIEGSSGVEPNNCLIEGDGIKGGYVNEQSTFTIFAKDKQGRTVSKSGEPFAAYIAGPNDVKIIGDISDLGNGQYDVRYTPPIIGNYAVAVYHSSTPIQQQFNFVVIERPKSNFPQVSQQPIQQHVMLQTKPSTTFEQGKPGEMFVIDVGSSNIKAGYQSHTTPTLIVPSVIGKHVHSQTTFSTQNVFVGEEAIGKRGILSLSYPFQQEPIDFESVKLLMKHLIDMSRNHPICLVQKPVTPLQVKINLCEILFNENVPSVTVVDEAQAISAYCGKKSCIIVDIGGMSTWVTPVVNGVVYKDISKQLPIGGVKCTEYFTTLLKNDGVTLGSTSSEKEIARQIMESIGFVTVDENQQVPIQNYELPDGTSVSIGKARTRCYEPLFKPQTVALTTEGISEMIASVLKSINGSTNEIILVGGCSLTKGLKERIEMDTTKLLNLKVNITATEDRKYLAWKAVNKNNAGGMGKKITLDTWKSQGAMILDE